MALRNVAWVCVLAVMVSSCANQTRSPTKINLGGAYFQSFVADVPTVQITHASSSLCAKYLENMTGFTGDRYVCSPSSVDGQLPVRAEFRSKDHSLVFPARFRTPEQCDGYKKAFTRQGLPFECFDAEKK
jgi:hypothetical protein